MKTSTLIVVMICLSGLLGISGCLDAVAGKITRDTMTDNTSYADLSASLGPVGETQARVWVYAMGGGTGLGREAGGIEQPITLNESVHWLLGDTFYHIDVPTGHYTVTTTNTRGYWNRFHRGDIQEEYEFEAGREYFIRVRFPRGLEIRRYPFDLVEKSQALPEMEGREHYTNGQKWGEIQIKEGGS